ncbi:hypothetical protein L6452_06540 [Arctium lappa]|uniref:Uncharacterized protein n=1 Tax=Arctium lappa TaxID=4217 RepID=A0ACB9EKI1_ARCLA|nr:hypothetical protein L6452_06540 [Arctium lappa]
MIGEEECVWSSSALAIDEPEVICTTRVDDPVIKEVDVCICGGMAELASAMVDGMVVADRRRRDQREGVG